jgi:Fe-S cluster biosynthesis and repair protein YggX
MLAKEKNINISPKNKKKLSSQNKKYFFSDQSIKINYGLRNIFGIKYFGF